jgi:hypothetical protein
MKESKLKAVRLFADRSRRELSRLSSGIGPRVRFRFRGADGNGRMVLGVARAPDLGAMLDWYER